jgi:cell division protein FtsA
MVAGYSEAGELLVLGSGHRASQGIKRGYVTDMSAATYALRDAVERAERMAGVNVDSVWIGASGAGLASSRVGREIAINGARISDQDIEELLFAANDSIQPDGRIVLHAEPAHYTLDGAHGIANPRGLHAETLGVDIHVMLADGAPIRNLIEAVENAHLKVDGVIASPIASGYSCLSIEERELGVSLVEIGAEVTNLALYRGGNLVGLTTLAIGSGAITDAIASKLGIKRFQAERLKCVHGSALASPTDHREMIPIGAAGEEVSAPISRYADAKNRIPRAELVSIITAELGRQMDDISRNLRSMDMAAAKGQVVVMTGGGAQLAGLADYAQSALGRAVRIGKPLEIKGLAEAHAVPGFATLAGLVLYAAADPVDIRALGQKFQHKTVDTWFGIVLRMIQSLKEFF